MEYHNERETRRYGKGRTFTPEFKFEALVDIVRGEKTIAQNCREQGITESLRYKWFDAYFERGPSNLHGPAQQCS